MSGHSKWAQIKRKKGATDVKRGKLFSQLIKAITVAARTGQNLEMAVERAKAANMPADNIDRAIKRGTGESGGGVQIESLTYEVYGPAGAALLVNVLTDNKNRSLAELKAVLNKQGGRLAESGSVQYLFERIGIAEVISDNNRSQDELDLLLIDAGAKDLEHEDDRTYVYTNPYELTQVHKKIADLNLKILDTKFTNVPKMTIILQGSDEQKLIKLMEAIEELDDVESVETNADLGGVNENNRI